MKTKEISSSFSMKKNLGNYQTADMWFSQTVEVDEKENNEEVAQKLYDFCKKMALKQYNEFSVAAPAPKTPEEEYDQFGKGFDLGGGKGTFPLQSISKNNSFVPNEVTYGAVDRDGTKKKIDKKTNTTKPL